MKKLSGIKLQLAMAVSMFLISIFMTVSYYFEISSNNADNLKTTAFYIWIVSIFAWLIKIIHDSRRIKQLSKDNKRIE